MEGSEDEARALIELLPDGVVAADDDGLVTLVSAQAARMLAIDAADVVGKPLADVLTLVDHDGNDWVATNDPYGGLPSRTGVPEQSWLVPDGTEVLVVARIERDRSAGRVRRLVLSIRSGRGRARLDRERADLLATVAHELRSPLTGVKGFVNALLVRWDRLTDDQRKLMLTTASVDADRLGRLIAELLDVARIDTGRLRLHRLPVDAAEMAARAIDSVGQATSRPLRLEAGASGDVPLVDADPDKLTQVLTNVVENAVRHGAGEVVVAVRDDPDNHAVLLSVSDEGEGIPEDLRRRVFTKFWTAGTAGGSGLGLYIVHSIVRAHGGTIAITDRPGGGTTMTISWPVATPMVDSSVVE